MDPLEFLEVARNFRNSTVEAETRTAIGRSYFALFNFVRAKLEAFKKFPGTADDHDHLVHYLTFANDLKLKTVGQYLRDLRAMRNIADYRMELLMRQADGRLMFAKAEKALETLRQVNDGRLKAEIDAQPTYRGRRTDE